MPVRQPLSAALAEAIGWLVAHSQDASPEALPPGPRELAELLWLARQLPPTPRRPGGASIGSTTTPEPNLPGTPPVSEPGPHPERPGLPPDPFLPKVFPAAADTAPQDTLLPVMALPTDRDVARDLEGVLKGRVRRERPLGDREALVRALAPLLRRQADPRRQRFAEEATVALYAQTGLLQPQFEPCGGPAFDEVLLLCDGGVSMRVWRRQAAELRQVLASTQVFARVRLGELQPGPVRRNESRAERRAAVARLSGAARLLPGSRPLLLVLSDAAGRHWWDGRMFAVLELWARCCPTAILQPLPLWHWNRTALAAVERVSVRNGRPAASNGAYRAEPLPWWQPPLPPGRDLAVPVLPLERDALGTWSAVVMGQPACASAGVALLTERLRRQRLRRLLGDRDLAAPSAAPPPSTAEEAEALWQAFQSMASVEAQQLLRVMATSPLLTLPVIDLLKAARLPEVDSYLPLAEVLTSGLVVGKQATAAPLPQASGRDAQVRRAERLEFEVLAPVAVLLRQQLSALERRDVISRVSALVERRWNRNRRADEPSFEAMLCDPKVAPPKGMEGVVQFAAVTARLLDTLPGEAARAFAERIRKGSRLPPGSVWPEAMEFKPLPFETAAVVDVPPTEGLTITAAWLAQLELQRILFSTARVTTQISPGRVVERSDGPQMVLKEPGAYAAVTALIGLPDGRLAAGSADGSIRVWDPASSSVNAVLQGHRGAVCALALLPEGSLASGSGDGTIRLWDLASGSCLAAFEGHQGWVKALAVLPDGRLASGSDDSTIRLWDQASGSCLAVFEGHQGSVFALAVLPDGRLASGSDDRTIRIWNLASGDCQQILESTSGSVQALGLLADGRLIASAEDGCILVWEPIAVPLPRPDPVVGFSSQQASAWGFHEPLQRDHLPFGAVVERPDPLALTLVEIPAGSFLMGSPPDEPERYDDEGPQHEVTLESFFMSQTPITQAQWRQVALWKQRPGESWGRELDPEPSFFQPRRNPKASGYDDGRFSLLEGESTSDQRPVDNVSWLDAIEFCNRLSQRTGRHYTLPSEAQWEYACRAGSGTPFHFGPIITLELANYDGNYTYANGQKGEYRKQTTPVGMFPANAWGLNDMHGNLWEWCQDHWHDSYEGAPSNGSAWENIPERNETPTKKERNGDVSDEERRLLRGGSWINNPRDCRSPPRAHDQPDFASSIVGFRVVCLPQGPSVND
jgi:formylglycine-generating enzyme required for sulfatase activity